MGRRGWFREGERERIIRSKYMARYYDHSLAKKRKSLFDFPSSCRVAELPNCEQVANRINRHCKAMLFNETSFFFKQKTLKKKRPKMRERLFLLVSIDRNGRSNSVKPRDHCVDIVENEGDIKKKRICKRTSRDVMEL